MSLEHHLRVASPWVPELDTTVLGAGHDPLSIRGQSNAEDEILKVALLAIVEHTSQTTTTYSVTLKRLHTSSALGSLVDTILWARGAQLPHLDSPVQTAADKILATRREGNTVNTVLVSIRTLEALDQGTVCNVPDANTLVQGASCDQQAVGRDGHSRDTIFNGEGQNAVSGLDIPEPDSAVATTRCNRAAVSRKV